MKTFKIILSSLLLFVALSPNVYALGGGGSRQPSATSQQNSDYQAGVRAVKKHDWTTAINHLEKAVKSDPNNANAWNYLGYSYRKSGNLNKAFPAYDRAIAIDPNHKGAHEYLGEAYLQAGNLPKAQAELDKLTQICGKNCDQTRDLKKAIDAYKVKHPTSSSNRSNR
jgi:tetratricopeptide (TPR) repeat protein